MNPFFAAIRFLTILPLPKTWGSNAADLSNSIPYFPIVGMLLGGAAALLGWGLALIAPAAIMSALMLVIFLGFSGGLHMDGLADTADGFLSSRPREEILRIMKDSHIGPMGVIGIISILLLKFSTLASLPHASWLAGLFLTPVAGRCAMVLHMAVLPYARPQGLGSVFYIHRPVGAAFWALLAFSGLSVWLLGITGFYLIGIWLFLVMLLAAYCNHKISGATGDTFGAVCEIAELTPALVLAIRTFAETR